MAKKPTRYPKKFRQKLEKMQATREVRESDDDELYEQKVTATLWREVIAEGSVALMHAVLDEQHHRVDFTMHLNLHSVDFVFRPPPWQNDDTESSPPA